MQRKRNVKHRFLGDLRRVKSKLTLMRLQNDYKSLLMKSFRCLCIIILSGLREFDYKINMNFLLVILKFMVGEIQFGKIMDNFQNSL